MTTGSNTSSNSVTFTFSANDTGGKEGKGVGINHFECSIDNSNFTTCTSPVQFTPYTLVDGSHVFKIRAEDNVGNKDPSPSSFNWTIDTVLPTTTINTVIDGNKSTITNGSNIRSNSVTFTFSANDTGGVGVDHIECSLDNSNFTTCTSTIQFTPHTLVDGSHVFKIRAEDNVRNKDLSPPSFSWTVDRVPPVTSINTAIDGNKSAIRTGGNTSSNSVTFAFSAMDTGGKEDKGVGINHFECSIDNSNFIMCTSPLQLNNLKEGIHKLNILSKDNVGNKETSPSSFIWTVDTVPPVTSINTATDGSNQTIENNDNSSSTSMKFEFSANDTGGVGVDHIECSLDSITFTFCTSPIQYSSANISDGAHILEIRAEDNVGNISPSPSSFTWTVDTIPPDTVIDSATDGNKTTIGTGG